MNKALRKTLNKIDDLDLIDMDVGFGLSSLKLVYAHSDFVESKVKLFFNDIVFLRYFGRSRDNDGSLYIGQSSLLDVSDFLKKSKDLEINKHIEKQLTRGQTLEYFTIEGEVYIEIICQNISVTGFK